jgi:hypothetical protein
LNPAQARLDVCDEKSMPEIQKSKCPVSVDAVMLVVKEVQAA